MHPAYSVIFFTTASGAGYGLLVWLCIAAAIGFVAPTLQFGLIGLGLAVSLITFGLLSSTFHLGRPERAWRAFSQWQTSWLSREGVLALATFVPVAVLAISWVFYGNVAAGAGVAAWVAAGLAVLTVMSTGMIYQSLPTIRAWHQPLVVPVYVVLSLATGGVLFNLLHLALVGRTAVPIWATVALLLIAWVLKALYWSTIDGARKTYTVEAATGLGGLGKVRPLDPPHSAPNFVMREMGYHIARKHAKRLRSIAVVLLFVIPALGLPLLLASESTGVSVLLSLVIILATTLGVWTERWLFFAEAQHVVTLYYGAERA